MRDIAELIIGFLIMGLIVAFFIFALFDLVFPILGWIFKLLF